jgi:hypothetical protein
VWGGGLKKELGCVSERRGRSPRRVRERGSAAVAGKTELTKGPHGAARERERVHGRTVHGADEAGPQHKERLRRARGKLAPTGRPQWAEGARACGRGMSLTRGTHLSGETGARGWLCWAKIAFPFFAEFPNAFIFIFSIEFKSNSNPIHN